MQLSIEQIRPELTWRLRHEVLYPHKKIHEMEMEEDSDGFHFAAFTDNKVVAVVSLFQNCKDFQFRKFAVDPAYQSRGIGSSVLTYITDFAKTNGGTRLWCNARLSAVDFYLKYGFSSTGKTFTRDGFDYEIIEKPLA
jgi:phosphoribosylformimino-5-aminoimidazole carboxamide ribotide isomerase